MVTFPRFFSRQYLCARLPDTVCPHAVCPRSLSATGDPLRLGNKVAGVAYDIEVAGVQGVMPFTQREMSRLVAMSAQHRNPANIETEVAAS